MEIYFEERIQQFSASLKTSKKALGYAELVSKRDTKEYAFSSKIMLIFLKNNFDLFLHEFRLFSMFLPLFM